MLFVLCYLLVQVESGELASTELSAALAENAKLRDEIESPASNAVPGPPSARPPTSFSILRRHPLHCAIIADRFGLDSSV